MFKRFDKWLKEPREYTNDDYFLLCLYCTIVIMLFVMVILDV